MAAIVIDGKDLAERVKSKTAEAAKGLPRKPGLAVILVGDDPASRVYVTGKEKDCAQCGFLSFEYKLEARTTQAELLALIRRLNAIDPDKDVDCFHPVNVGKLSIGAPVFLPCTPAGVMEILGDCGISPSGKRCVVVGRSNIVGKPMSMLLTQADGTVTTCHSRTPDLGKITHQADILVTAVGRVGLITADMVKRGAVVIDVAMNRNAEGKLCGDVDFAAVAKKASYITPVPGGVGPMTRAVLMENILTAARRHIGSVKRY